MGGEKKTTLQRRADTLNESLMIRQRAVKPQGGKGLREIRSVILMLMQFCTFCQKELLWQHQIKQQHRAAERGRWLASTTPPCSWSPELDRSSGQGVTPSPWQQHEQPRFPDWTKCFTCSSMSPSNKKISFVSTAEHQSVGFVECQNPGLQGSSASKMHVYSSGTLRGTTGTRCSSASSLIPFPHPTYTA